MRILRAPFAVLNSMSRIVAEKIESALIMESDADWDMRIKKIMAGVGEGAQQFVDWPFGVSRRQGVFPYGDSWDVIWIGHCGCYNHVNHRIYSWNDSSVPSQEDSFNFAASPLEEQHHPGTRTVFPFTNCVCSTAYAISYAGAVKLEQELSNGSLNLDIHLATSCRENQDLTCLGVWPQVITAAATKSNIQHPTNEIPNNLAEINVGPALQYSARKNAAEVMNGSAEDEWEAQWNYTWREKGGMWRQVDFEEAKGLDVNRGKMWEQNKGLGGRKHFWNWFDGKYDGVRSFG